MANLTEILEKTIFWGAFFILFSVAPAHSDATGKFSASVQAEFSSVGDADLDQTIGATTEDPGATSATPLQSRFGVVTSSAAASKEIATLVSDLGATVLLLDDTQLFVETGTTPDLIRRLSEHPEVEFIEEWHVLGREDVASPNVVDFNVDAQLTHGVPLLRTQHQVFGDGVAVGIWDAGSVLSNHVELTGRVENRDQSSDPHDHATHVAGTIGAQGVKQQAQGMAPRTKIVSYNWSADLKELREVAASDPNVRVTNHSYGFLRGWSYSRSRGAWVWYGDPRISEREDYMFGKYSTKSALVDKVILDNPHLSVFVAAGNDRGRQGNDPSRFGAWNGRHWVYRQNKYVTKVRPGDHEVDGGYDTLEGMGVAKNTITIGAIEDILLGADRTAPENIIVTAFSNFGPTDDGRIKPDLVANGARLESPTAELLPDGRFNPYAYIHKSGTSMATPAASGVGSLLTQVSMKVRGQGLRADEMKAVLVATAISPQDGPSYRSGWGAIRADAAGDVIAANTKALVTAQLGAGQVWTAVELAPEAPSEGEEDADPAGISVTLVWLDPPAPPNSAGLDDPKSTLVHDLDLMVVDPDGKERFPWSLNPVQPAADATRSGTNKRDTVERVDAPRAGTGKTWTIEVSGASTAADQGFALAVTGLELKSRQ